eukprot:TRINITY_DN1882_c0_g1_i1.p1 TRINITY_DN1882_c0_g1~~TRINITY_DN1882_c0_g1_i1.p1  ORF type:complete len:265 (-),score=55.40 TRINITY_DN1882_c0_g1_i1:69-863(-)
MFSADPLTSLSLLILLLSHLPLHTTQYCPDTPNPTLSSCTTMQYPCTPNCTALYYCTDTNEVTYLYGSCSLHDTEEKMITFKGIDTIDDHSQNWVFTRFDLENGTRFNIIHVDVLSFLQDDVFFIESDVIVNGTVVNVFSDLYLVNASVVLDNATLNVSDRVVLEGENVVTVVLNAAYFDAYVAEYYPFKYGELLNGSLSVVLEGDLVYCVVDYGVGGEGLFVMFNVDQCVGYTLSGYISGVSVLVGTCLLVLFIFIAKRFLKD